MGIHENISPGEGLFAKMSMRCFRQLYIAPQSPHRADVTLLRTCQIILDSRVKFPSLPPTVCNLHGQPVCWTGLVLLNPPLPKPTVVLQGMRGSTSVVLTLVPGGFDTVFGWLVFGLMYLRLVPG